MTAWAIKWRSKNRLDGKRSNLVGRYAFGVPDVPAHMAGYTLMAFKTRKDAQAHIREYYSYIKDRPDLRREPFGWMMPQPVRVRITVEPA